RIVNSVIIYTPSETIGKAIMRYRDYIERETRIRELKLVNSIPDGARHWIIEDNDVYVVVNI
ncbi:MAG: hypothetical protein QXJ56_05975, partial [Ignisphaera sp.]